uniref:Uncharacterized protein n=1 Tax=Engystomops pustulosus TaxID=76066 RepID=A0AAV6YCX3_ENGPU|nr:hypothetical protein GDO81_029989 [Engystomops pustulosus]
MILVQQSLRHYMPVCPVPMVSPLLPPLPGRGALLLCYRSPHEAGCQWTDGPACPGEPQVTTCLYFYSLEAAWAFMVVPSAPAVPLQCPLLVRENPANLCFS